ncbi:7-deoxyloganetin glucosyltransferase [Glycine soja]
MNIVTDDASNQMINVSELMLQQTREECECLKWLDSQELNLVLYVNFGNVIVMRHQQLVELAWGLANSKKKFMWVIRPDLVEGEASILPPEIVEETKDKGLLVGWYISREWAFGMEMDSHNVTRAEVEKLVKELLEGEKGKEMKKKAIKGKKLA